MLMFALTMQAQPRCAVFQFQAGEGVNDEDIELISFTFRSNFNLSNYRVLDHDRVTNKVEAMKYSQTEMTPQQLLRAGRALDAAIIVVGTLTKMMDEYIVTIDVTKTENNQRIASETATFERSKYRDNMKTLAQSLAKKLGSGSSSNGTSTNGSSSNGSSSGSAGTTVQAGYTDLGLPSGTIWKNFNATGFYTYDEAVSQFGSRLPTKAQWEELKAECRWTWNGSGYKVTGPNGNSIVLPAEGFRNCYGSVINVGSNGYYWSSSPKGSDYAWRLDFDSSSVYVLDGLRCNGRSVRLVQDN